MFQVSQHNYLHSLQSDELFFYHSGSGELKISYLDPEAKGQLTEVTLSKDSMQVAIPAGHFLCQSVKGTENDFVLFSVVVSPGFDPADSTPGKRDELTKEFPEQRDFIAKFTQE